MLNAVANVQDVLSYFLLAGIWSLLMSCLAIFLQFCYRYTPGFEQYYDWLYSINGGALEEIAKPFGTCVYCQGTWIFIISWVLFFPGLTILAIPFLGLNYVITDLLNTHVDYD